MGARNKGPQWDLTMGLSYYLLVVGLIVGGPLQNTTMIAVVVLAVGAWQWALAVGARSERSQWALVVGVHSGRS